MTIREILVVIESQEIVARRVAPAAALATAAGASLTGLFATGYPISASYGDTSGWLTLVETYMEAQRSEGAAAEATFRQELGRHKLGGDWIYRESAITDNAIALAALFDLIVLGQPDPDADTIGSFGMTPSEVVLAAGRPVLVVPYAGDFTTVGRRVIVAWNASRESARALHDAMPLLESAEAVTVIEVAPAAPLPGLSRATAADVAEALTRRGIAATAETETAGDISIDDLLLSRAADLSADLMVMGAYGHSRLREYVLGGVSQGIFRHMTVPVLMSH
ncbi:MAG TPA: universal stress protein [Stellaceae bacterium]|jgi:nucleotide-binding universal stress UspA family protein|nr:universal stress protein [Stellaceae bacterium]